MAVAVMPALDVKPPAPEPIKPVSLTVKLPETARQSANHLGEGLRELYCSDQFTDVSLACAGQAFHAHRLVLAAESEVFKKSLSADAGAPGVRQEIQLEGITNPEAVKVMLDHIYQKDLEERGDYDPKTMAVNQDVLRLAQDFKLPSLEQLAKRWLADSLTTGNVVECLTICESFSLHDLRERVIEQLASNKRALAEVSFSPQIMKYPKLMQVLLQQAASRPEESQPKKKGRTA